MLLSNMLPLQGQGLCWGSPLKPGRRDGSDTPARGRHTDGWPHPGQLSPGEEEVRVLWGPLLTSPGVRQGFLEEVGHQSWVLSMAHITDVQMEAQNHVYFRVVSMSMYAP